MKSLDCPRIVTSLSSVHDQISEFQLLLAESHPRSNFEPIRKLETDIEEALTSLENELFPREVTMEEAREIMGEDRFLGPEDVEKVFGVKVENVPPIHFTAEMLENLKNSCRLVLYIDKLPNNKPLTAVALLDSVKNTTSDNWPILNTRFVPDDWTTKEQFFMSDTPTLEWRLVSDDIIRDYDSNVNSIEHTYFQQTEILVRRIKSLYEGEMFNEIPEHIQNAINDVKDISKDTEFLQKITNRDLTKWKPIITETLVKLNINQMFRESLVQLMYRFILIDRARNTKILKNFYSWTNSRASDGRIILGGYFGSKDDNNVDRWYPFDANSYVGCAFSASEL